MKYAFILVNRGLHSVELLCRLLDVSSRGFYKWLNREPSARSRRKEELTKEITAAYQDSRETYGSERIYRELRGSGIIVNHKTVERIMRENGIVGRRPKRFVPTTNSTHGLGVAPNYLSRNFTTNEPNVVWVGDITYIGTAQGTLYLATVLDLFSRKIVGWSMSSHLGAELAVDSFCMARKRRQASPQMFHSDRGSQYASRMFRKVAIGSLLSMSRKANCWDNAVAESFFATLKVELVHRCRFLTRTEARTQIFDYVETFYNTRRKHSHLGYLSPMEFEKTRSVTDEFAPLA